MAKLVYLVGKVQGRKWSVAAQANQLGANCNFVASDSTKHSEHGWGFGWNLYSPDSYRSAVEQSAIVPITDADLVVAYLDTPTAYGSIAEIAWAASQRWTVGKDTGKSNRVLMLHKCTDGTESSDWDLRNQYNDTYWFTASLPQVCAAEVHSEHEAARIIAAYARTESPIERLFYEACIERRLGGMIEAQRTVNANGKTYRLDFFIPYLNLAIECDGHDYHASKEARTRDAERDRNLRFLNIEVARFTGTEIYRNPEVGADHITARLGGYDCIAEVRKLVDDVAAKLTVPQ